MVLLDFLARVALWVLTHTLYRIRIGGKEHVPVRGPALLVCNHLSHIDGLLVGACIPRSVRFSVFKTYSRDAALNWLMRPLNAIPVGDRGDASASVERGRAELRQGHVVCIFAEGAISRTGNLLPFSSGFERIADGLAVPVIPVCLDQVWGSVFSFKNGRFFWKWPTRVPYRVTMTFGAPLPSTNRCGRRCWSSARTRWAAASGAAICCISAFSKPLGAGGSRSPWPIPPAPR
jgi:acyl-[acyl-carrier-protein]-phospholipid O-acyltransferase/long-chain-fatty-acid--[acyl-carrier-protein] ligase